MKKILEWLFGRKKAVKRIRTPRPAKEKQYRVNVRACRKYLAEAAAIKHERAREAEMAKGMANICKQYNTK